jgi:hypothetical protein
MMLNNWLKGWGMRRRGSRTGRRWPGLTLEGLENRATPAIVFRPDFDADALALFDNPNNPNLNTALTAAMNKYAATFDATLAPVAGGTTMSYLDPANTRETVQLPGRGIGPNEIYLRVRLTPTAGFMFGSPGQLGVSRGDEIGAGVLSVNAGIATNPVETLANLTSGFEHEIGHIFGFVSGIPNFDQWVPKDANGNPLKDANGDPFFTGPNARAAFGGRDVPLDPVPVDLATGKNLPLHWAPAATLGQLATMQALVQTELTPLDVAAILDLGWRRASSGGGPSSTTDDTVPELTSATHDTVAELTSANVTGKSTSTNGSLTFTFADATAKDHKAVIDWGDGKRGTFDLGVSSGGTFTFHHHFRHNHRKLTVVVTDDQWVVSNEFAVLWGREPHHRHHG